MTSNTIFNIKTAKEFDAAALEVFRHQYLNNNTYQRFCNLIGVSKNSVSKTSAIPFLPISFFKTKKIVTGDAPSQQTFSSSGTTGSTTSKHHVTDLSWYEKSFNEGFRRCYGEPANYTILAVLPSYLEREDSSLIYMVSQLIRDSKNPDSGFYLNNIRELATLLKKKDAESTKILLIGVSFALLDLIATYQFDLKNTIIMETGGMKGRRKELIREELHTELAAGFGVSHIHSEYGMTELLSQAYSTGAGIFQCPPWMRVYTRDPEDALTLLPFKKTGGINIIDLANYNSCSFIATQDLGRVLDHGDFEVLGRFDNSDIRGCNLMV